MPHLLGDQDSYPAGFCVVLENGIVWVWQPHCHACKATEPALEATTTAFPDVQLRKVDASVERDEILRLGVKGTPTLVAFKDGEETGRATGARTADELATFFASTENGARVAKMSGQDRLIRGGAGAALVVLGIVKSVSWPLLILGAVLVVWVVWDSIQQG